MDKDTTKGFNPPKTARNAPITNGIIINGTAHVLVESQGYAPCNTCSLQKPCDKSFSPICRIFTDEVDNVAFRETDYDPFHNYLFAKRELVSRGYVVLTVEQFEEKYSEAMEKGRKCATGWKPTMEQMDCLMRTVTWLAENGNFKDSSTIAILRKELKQFYK